MAAARAGAVVRYKRVQFGVMTLATNAIPAILRNTAIPRGRFQDPALFYALAYCSELAKCCTYSRYALCCAVVVPLIATLLDYVAS